MPAALLDANAISDAMRDHPQLKANAANHSDPVLASVVAVGEVLYGLRRLPAGKKRSDLETRAQGVLATLTIEPLTEPVADVYGQLRASLEASGLNLNDNDLWIAATALSAGYLLVTRDQDFRHIPGLQVVDWSV
jgi:tRNA(fMet)-specific endonuclease VapC